MIAAVAVLILIQEGKYLVGEFVKVKIVTIFYNTIKHQKLRAFIDCSENIIKYVIGKIKSKIFHRIGKISAIIGIILCTVGIVVSAFTSCDTLKEKFGSCVGPKIGTLS